MIPAYYHAPVDPEGSVPMRGDDPRHDGMFSYITPEARVRPDHPLRPIRRMTDAALAQLSPRFDRLYSTMGRPSIPPEKLLRALLLQMLYSIRSERLLMEELDYNILYRWFVGLSLDDAVWDATTFTKNRDRLLEGDIAQAFFDEVQAESDELAARFREFCFTMPEPDPSRIFSEVYAEPSPAVTAQRDELLGYLDGFAEQPAAAQGGVH